MKFLKKKNFYFYYSWIVRIILFVLWSYSSIEKLLQREAFAYKINAYKIEHIDSNLLSIMLILCELFIAFSFIFNLYFGKILSILLLLIYIAGITSLWIRGIYINCGCFSLNNDEYNSAWKAHYPIDIIRDLGLVLLTLSILKNKINNGGKTPKLD